MNLTSDSLYNFIIITPNQKEFLYKIKDLSKVSQTETLIANEISQIIEFIRLNKFAAVVTDNGENVRVACERITKNILIFLISDV